MNAVKIGKKLSYMLRHSQNPTYIDLCGGWAPVNIIIQSLGISKSQLDEVVATDSKCRYSYDKKGQYIRANQGHSIPGVSLEMEQPYPPEYLYHGTATRFINSIIKDGILPMSRQFVHISSDIDTAIKVGKRHGNPVVLKIHAQDFVNDGNELFRSTNGVWQAMSVPPRYFEVVFLCDEDK